MLRGIEKAEAVTAQVAGLTTTLEWELQRMEAVVEKRLCGYIPHKWGGKIENVVGILLSGSKDKGKKMEENWLEKIRSAVEWAVIYGQPINISLAWACGTTAMSSYKFIDSNNLPRLGDIWTLFWFSMLNQKVQVLHPPGIRLVIIDEVPHGLIVGRTEEEIALRQGVMRALALKYAPFTEIVSLPFFRYDGIVDKPCNEEVLAILMSLPGSIPEEVCELCYRVRNKPWGRIQQVVSEGQWKKAVDIRIAMKRVDAGKKETHFTASLFCGAPFIEACIVEKGRWSPDIWSMAFPQHGGTALDTKGQNRFSISCVPEVRLLSNGHEPVMVSSRDFQAFSELEVPNSPFTFYWVPKKGDERF